MSVKHDSIGLHYNRTRQADPYLTQRTLFHPAPSATGLYLDLSCGTGNHTHKIAVTEKYFIQNDLQDLFLYNAKQEPR